MPVKVEKLTAMPLTIIMPPCILLTKAVTPMAAAQDGWQDSTGVTLKLVVSFIEQQRRFHFMDDSG